jgi:type I restriction enzyme, S subunit
MATSYLAKITPCFENGKLGIATELTNGIGFGSSEYTVFRPNKELSNEYLYYFLSQESFRAAGIDTMSGAVGHKRVSKDFIERCQIPPPPLPEQQRIVAILDEAFAGLATATANAEKNLKNARELFESYLNSVFGRRGKDWKEQRLGDAVVSVNTGPFGSLLHKSDYVDGGIPIVNPINIVEALIVPDANKTVSVDTVKRLSAYKLSKNDVVVGRRGEIGRCAPVRDEQVGWLCGTGCFFIRTGEAVDANFLSHLLRSVDYSRQLERVATGTTMKNLSNTALQNFAVSLPPLSEQRRLKQAFARMAEATERAANTYERRLIALATLKQSILQKAFAGELTSRLVARTKTQVAIAGISATDLHAGVIAIAYQKHQGHLKQNTFGHVKAEKIAHMVEARVGIDLGRNPVKDAAGPNDYPHLMRVEHRANMAGYFSVKRLAHGPYSFSKKNKFDEIVRRSRAALGERNQAVDSVMDMMLPMDTEQAEILATVFAAWNNLLLDSRSVDDEAIVREARENWHPDKLQIARERFFAALEWMRKNNVVPKGDGKKVVERAKK